MSKFSNFWESFWWQFYLFTLRAFARNPLRGNRRRNIFFHILVWCLTNKPTHYLTRLRRLHINKRILITEAKTIAYLVSTRLLQIQLIFADYVWTNWTLYGVIQRSLCKIHRNDVSELFNCWEWRWIDGASHTLSTTAAIFSGVRTAFGFSRFGL